MIRDMAFFTIALVIFAFAIIVSYVALDNLNTSYQSMPELNAQGKTAMSDFTNRYDNVFDYAFLMVFFAALIGVLALSYYVEIIPIVFFAVLFVVVVIAAVAGYLSNAWAEALEQDVLSAAAANFPITSFILENYMVFIGVFGFLALIVFFMKPGGVNQ